MFRGQSERKNSSNDSQFAEDLLSKRNVGSIIEFHKLRFPKGTHIYVDANLCGYNKNM